MAQDTPTQTTFPARLRAWREARSLSQRALARKIGRSVGTIIRWEQGRSEPLVTDVEKIAKAIGVNPGDLVDPFIDPDATAGPTESTTDAPKVPANDNTPAACQESKRDEGADHEEATRAPGHPTKAA